MQRMKKLNMYFESAKKSKLIWIPLVVIIALILYRFKGLLVAATVNNQPISRLTVLQELEKQGGKQIMDNLVTNALIRQEAKKQNLSVSQDEVKAQLDDISNNLTSQGQDLVTALAAQGMTENDLKSQIELKILVDKLAAKDINVTDKEVEDYFTQNKDLYGKDAKLADLKDQIKTTLQSQKTSEAINSWLTTLKSNAKINYFVNY